MDRTRKFGNNALTLSPVYSHPETSSWLPDGRLIGAGVHPEDCQAGVQCDGFLYLRCYNKRTHSCTLFFNFFSALGAKILGLRSHFPGN
jgi:hypothetical protein